MTAIEREEIDRLIDDLDADTDAAESAQALLPSLGPRVIVPLLQKAPGFGRYGKLCAIEVLSELRDPRAGDVLIPMLSDDDETVREWAAEAVGELGIAEAVPGLRRLYDNIKSSDVPLDWTLPQTVRVALTTLGERHEVVPDRVAQLAFSDRTIRRCWWPEDLLEVINDLADSGQVILYFQYWSRWRDTHTRLETPSWEVNWALPWPAMVEDTRLAARAAVNDAGTPAGSVATIAWIDENDA